MTDEVTIHSLADLEPKMKLKGEVKQIQLAGAIIDVGLEECDGLLHISQVRRRRVNNVRDFLEEGQKVTVWVLNVDMENARLNVTMIKPADLDWSDLAVGQVYDGKVVRIEKFGVFVDIGAERPGLVHISELAHGYVTRPEDVIEKGQDVQVKVIGVDVEKRQIDLSIKAALPEPEPEVREESVEEEVPTAMALALQRALQADGDKQTSASDDEPRRKQKKNEQDDIMRRTLERHEKH